MADGFTYTYQAPPMNMGTGWLLRSDGAVVPLVLDNSEYQEFLSAIAAGMAPPEGWTGPQNPSPA